MVSLPRRSDWQTWPVLGHVGGPTLTLGWVFCWVLCGSKEEPGPSLIADSMTRTSHNPNRELVGQGIGNTVAGFIGGLPGAGATMGTVVNLRAGGRTQISGVLRAANPPRPGAGTRQNVEAIPHAALAGILMKVGWDIIGLALSYPRPPRSEGAPPRYADYPRTHRIPSISSPP